MPSLSLTTPALRALIARVQADIATDTGEDDVYIRGTFARAAALALAGAVKGVYGFAAGVANELHPATMVDWGIPLWASALGLTRTAAIAAVHPVTITFTGAATVALGAVFVGPDGTEYTLNAAVTRGSAGTSAGVLTASTAGDAGTLDAGATVTLQTPVANVSNSATVSAATTDGADEEALETLKSRVLLRLGSPPQGGAEADYEAWTLAASSEVVRVAVLSNTPWLGNVTVYFTVQTDGTSDGFIPSAGQVTIVQAALDANCPAHAVGLVTAAAPNGIDVDMEIDLSDNSSEMQNAVADALDVYFAQRAPGLTTLDVEDVRATIRAAVRALDTEETFSLVSLDGSVPPITVTGFGVGTVPYRGNITFGAL